MRKKKFILNRMELKFFFIPFSMRSIVFDSQLRSGATLEVNNFNHIYEARFVTSGTSQTLYLCSIKQN